MLQKSLGIENLDLLRNLIYQELCQQNEFELGVFPMTEKVLVRRKKPCGIFFCLHGPRNVRITAIWETDQNTVLFYRCTGERLQKLRLVDSSRLAELPAERQSPAA